MRFLVLFSLRFWLAISLLVGFSFHAKAEEFDVWRSNLRTEAVAKGISASLFDEAFQNVFPIARIIELDRNQPEFTLTLSTYLQKVVSGTRAKKARIRIEEHKDILAEVSAKYGVQPRFIVALWGIETNFGQHTGGFSVVAALATLAYDGRRSAYFRKELLHALTILQEGHIKPADMKGSWAGAMGQSQFMPSSFLSYATDWDGDGRRDIWTTQNDVFASIANYLSSVGWRDDLTWGREVKVPAGLDATSLSKSKTKKTMDEWRALGITSADGSPLPKRNLISRLVVPAKSDGRVFLVYRNYDNILKWNRSNYFAIAVGSLADDIAYR
ncbi:lytic murein transglycosylase [Alphaproteobacteria bacterium]|nr:lytic murein transglycosylase [Alphaproteobacteria bacterium]